MKKKYYRLPIILLLVLFSSNVFAQSPWAVQVSGVSTHLHAIAFFKDGVKGIAVGAYGTILYTTDGGISWIHTSTGENYPLHDIEILNSHEAITGDMGRCMDGGCGNIFRTLNGGTTWSDEGMLFTNIKDIAFLDSLEGIIVGGYYDLGGTPRPTAFHSTNGGNTWPDLPNLNQQTMFYSAAFKTPTFLVGCANGDTLIGATWRHKASILFSSNHGTTWTSLFDTLDMYFYGISFPDTASGTVVGQHGCILHTNDGGLTWQKQQSPTSNDLNSVYSVSTQEAYIAGSGGTILHTTDSGVTWIEESSGTTNNLNSVFFLDAQHGWVVGNDGTILKYVTFPTCRISDPLVDFGTQPIDSSLTKSLSISNTGTEPLLITSINSSNGDFTFFPTSFEIPPGNSQQLQITFSPSSEGRIEGELSLIHNATGSPDTILLTGIGQDYGTTSVLIDENWNLVSIPRVVDNDSCTVLFPSAVSSLFRFVQNRGYLPVQTAQQGEGYWLKFNTAQSIDIAGVKQKVDTIYVFQGWNIIGSISDPVSTDSIIQIPPDNTNSGFWGYGLGYALQNILMPGRGYWIKVKEDGLLILRSE